VSELHALIRQKPAQRRAGQLPSSSSPLSVRRESQQAFGCLHYSHGATAPWVSSPVPPDAGRGTGSGRRHLAPIRGPRCPAVSGAGDSSSEAGAGAEALAWFGKPDLFGCFTLSFNKLDNFSFSISLYTGTTLQFY